MLQFSNIQSLVRFVAEQVIHSFLQHFTTFANNKNASYHDFSDEAADEIVRNIAGQWREITTAPEADEALEAMYNAARAELVRMLGLEGGTVDFGTGYEQPLTDQRIGQSEAWELWSQQTVEAHDDPDTCVWCGAERHPNDNTYCDPCSRTNLW